MGATEPVGGGDAVLYARGARRQALFAEAAAGLTVGTTKPADGRALLQTQGPHEGGRYT